ncbi:MAG TPA: DUF6531 domain-containing protein, partial [Thermoanaerobaculia bacterium]|nr:DUF6531 domain-containing protein [Thermoanaerobaculia bacterium]
MPRLLLACGLLAALIFAACPANANCTVALSPTAQPGQLVVHAVAMGDSCPWNYTPLGLSHMMVDQTAISGTINCGTTCTFDGVFNTYCMPPGSTHTLSGTCTGCSTGHTETTTFVVAQGMQPTIAASWVAPNSLNYSWTFDPHAYVNQMQIVIDGRVYSNPVPNASSGSQTAVVGLSACSAHTINVQIATCGHFGYEPGPWTATTTLTIPDPGDPTVSIKFKPSNGSYLGYVTYTFPSTGSRSLRVVRKAKPPYTMSDTDVVQAYSPADLSNTITFTPDSISGDQEYEAVATSGSCSPAHEAKSVASLDNSKCCPWTPPNGGGSGIPPSGLWAPGSVASPVRLTTGNMHYTDGEPLPRTLVSLTRTYDSGNTTTGAFGRGWTSLFDAGAVSTGSGNDQSVVINTEENKQYVWFLKNGAYIQTWPKDTASPAVLGGSATSGFTLREAGGDLVRTFSSSGRLIQLTSLSRQRSLSITYDGSGHPSQVTDSWGNVTLLLTTDPTSGLVSQIEVSGRPDVSWTYQYSSNLLTAVLAPDGQQWRQYQYAGGLLATILDPLGNLIESHTYDANGRAITSSQATNDVASIQYGLAGRDSSETLTTVTYASGKVSNYYSRSEGSSVLTADVFGGCSACSSENGTYVYDDAGRVIRSQDARGYITDVAYAAGVLSSTHGPLKPSSCDPSTDTNHCRMTVEDLTASAVTPTSQTLTTNYVYGDSRWPDKPASITVDSVANPGGTRLQTLTYDAATGQVLTQTDTGWTSATQSETHTTTTTLYNGSEGSAFTPGGPFSSSWLTLPQPVSLRKQIDGPRTDVTDVTMFAYYPIDSTVPATWRGRLAAVQDALGHITTYSDYDVFGNAQTVIDPNGVTVTSTYDPLGRLLTTKYPAMATCDTAADPTCNTDIIASRSYSPGGGPPATETKPRGGVTSYTYDSRGRVASVTRTISSTVNERIEYDYDPNTGQKSAERYLDNSSGSFVVKKSIAYSYDAEGRLSQILYPDNAAALYTYDVAGALATVQDENHAAANTFYDYNEAGRTRAVRQTLGTSQITTSYGYDAQGNLTSVTDPNGNVTTYAYDDFGRMMSQVSPVTGTTTYGYDPSGNLTTTADANGATTTRTYDALSRVTTAVSSRNGYPTETIGWSYDSAASGNFGIGRLGGTTYPAGSTTYSYQRRGLLRGEQSTLGGASYVSSYIYDADGNRTSLGRPSGDAAVYTFDLAGRPVTMPGLITGSQYLPFGPLNTLSYANGTTKTMTYDSRYRITENKLDGPAGTIADYTYSEDPAGNITSIHDATDATYNRDFTYDDLNRLVTANSGT